MPAQGETGLVVVERHGSPGCFTMAGLALLAFLSLMFIVFLVAGITLRWGLLLVQMAFVAAVACQPHVLSSEGIFRLPVMIKRQVFPVLLDMAVPASLPE